MTYLSPYPSRDWERVTWAYRLNEVAPQPGGLYYSPSATGLEDQPEWAAASDDARQHLLVLHLYRLFIAGAEFELHHVLQVAEAIAIDPGFIPALPLDARRDALRVFYDETTHAHLSDRFLRTIENETGIAAPRISTLAPRPRLPWKELLELFGEVFVVETLISTAQVPQDRAVDERVRANLLFHAQDEARHRKFFRQVFEFAWRTWGRSSRRLVAQSIADALVAYVGVDEDWLRGALVESGVAGEDSDLASRLRRASLEPAVLRRQAAPTLDILRGLDAFEDEEIRERFEALGLIERE